MADDAASGERANRRCAPCGRAPTAATTSLPPPVPLPSPLERRNFRARASFRPAMPADAEALGVAGRRSRFVAAMRYAHAAALRDSPTFLPGRLGRHAARAATVGRRGVGRKSWIGRIARQHVPRLPLTQLLKSTRSLLKCTRVSRGCVVCGRLGRVAGPLRHTSSGGCHHPGPGRTRTGSGRDRTSDTSKQFWISFTSTHFETVRCLGS